MSGSTRFSAPSPLRTSLTPNPLAYTVFPPCTTATAMPGMPDLRHQLLGEAVELGDRVLDGVVRQRPSRAPTAVGRRTPTGGSTVVRARRFRRAADDHNPQPTSRTSAASAAMSARNCSASLARTSTLAGYEPPPRVERRERPGIDPLPGPGVATTTRDACLIGGGEQSARPARTTDAARAGTSPSGSAPEARSRLGTSQVGAHRVLGIHVDVRPRRVIRADGISVRSKGPWSAPISVKLLVYPVSPPKNAR